MCCKSSRNKRLKGEIEQWRSGRETGRRGRERKTVVARDRGSVRSLDWMWIVGWRHGGLAGRKRSSATGVTLAKKGVLRCRDVLSEG